MSDRPLRIMITAGEPSGDRLGAGLAAALHRLSPGVELMGMGGEAMERAGVRILQDASAVAVVGIMEVVSHLAALRRAMGRLERALVDAPPDLLVPVDFPDFNLRLAARARRAQVPVVYFVSPQVWAWRRGRVRTIRRLVRRMLVLFAFETVFYRRAGVPVTHVGHPLAEDQGPPRPRETLCRLAGLDERRPVVALLPGSRTGEVARLLPLMLASAERLRRRRPELQFLIPLAPGVPRSVVTGELESHALHDVRIHAGDFPEVLSTCAAGVVAAGTASLEAAVTGLPIVVVYRMNPFTYALGRSLVRLENVALPNLVAGRRVVPELIQRDCRPERIAAEVRRYLEEPGAAAAARGELERIRQRLGEPGVFLRAARAVLDECGRRYAGREAK